MEKKSNLLYSDTVGELTNLRPEGEYLEVGAGPGILAAMIAKQNPAVSITALDSSEEMKKYGKNYCAKHGVSDRIRYLKADIDNPGNVAEIGQYDVVYSTFSLHHWNDPVSSFANIWKSVKTGGLMYILDLKRVWWLYFSPVRNGFFDSVKAAYLPGEIEEFLAKAGITGYSIGTIRPWYIQRIVAVKKDEGIYIPECLRNIISLKTCCVGILPLND